MTSYRPRLAAPQAKRGEVEASVNNALLDRHVLMISLISSVISRVGPFGIE